MKNFMGALLLSTSLLMVGCGSNNDLTHEQSCNQRFKNLQEKFEKEKYSSIREKLNDLISTCTGSGFMEKAQYMLAEAHFNLEEWLEAEHEYAIFLEDFPNSEQAENSHFRMAISKSEQLHSVGRDQSPTKEAILEFDNFIKKYTKSNLLDSAIKYKTDLQTILAEKDIYTGDLYIKLKEPQAAVIYYKGVKEKYGEIVNAAELNVKMIKSYIKLGQLKQAERLITELKDLENGEKYASQIKKLETSLSEKKAYELKLREQKKQKPTVEL